jgi:hypothetical protein
MNVKQGASAAGQVKPYHALATMLKARCDPVRD